MCDSDIGLRFEFLTRYRHCTDSHRRNFARIPANALLAVIYRRGGAQQFCTLCRQKSSKGTPGCNSESPRCVSSETNIMSVYNSDIGARPKRFRRLIIKAE